MIEVRSFTILTSLRGELFFLLFRLLTASKIYLHVVYVVAKTTESVEWALQHQCQLATDNHRGLTNLLNIFWPKKEREFYLQSNRVVQ